MIDAPDDRPQQFKLREAELHEVRLRMREALENWTPNETVDTRDMRDPQLLGVALLRMRRSGRLSLRHDRLEAARAIG